MMATWALPLAVGVLAYGVAQALAKRDLVALPRAAFLRAYLLAKVLVLSVAWLAWPHPTLAMAEATPFFAVAGLANIAIAAGWGCYFQALGAGPVMGVGTLTALYPAVTVVLAGLYLGGTEKLGSAQYAGVALALAAPALLAGRGDAGATRAWLPWALGTVVLWGAGSMGAKLAYTHALPPTSGWEVPYMLANLGALTLVLGPFAWRGSRAHPWSAGLGAALLLALGDACIYRAWNLGPTAMVTPLAGLYPLVTLAWAMGIGGEIMGWRQGLAIATALAATMLIAW